MLDLYRLEGKMAVRCETMIEWALYMEKTSRRVAEDEIGGLWISTIFLGIDHNFNGNGDPLLFETAVFAEDGVTSLLRYFTWAEAEAGHRELVEVIREHEAQADKLSLEVIRKLISA